jgi:hypothetical protein
MNGSMRSASGVTVRVRRSERRPVCHLHSASPTAISPSEALGRMKFAATRQLARLAFRSRWGRTNGSRRLQWTDVFLQRSGESAVNLTRGDGVSSRQPALSHDGRFVVYVGVADTR